jgi:hypothetical protein
MSTAVSKSDTPWDSNQGKSSSVAADARLSGFFSKHCAHSRVRQRGTLTHTNNQRTRTPSKNSCSSAE